MSKVYAWSRFGLSQMLSLSPSWRLWLPITWASLVLLLAVLYMHSQPWMGLSLDHRDGKLYGQAGMLLAIDGHVLQAQDLVEDPGSIEADAHYEVFLQRQNLLHQALLAPTVSLTWQNASGQVFTQVQKMRSTRPLDSLPFAFWLQCAIGWACMLIGSWVWALRPDDRATRLFALTGLCVLMFAVSAACYSSRGIALSGDDFAVLAFFNRFGATAYGFAGLAFFLCYPKPLLALPWLWLLLLAQVLLQAAMLFGLMPQFASQAITGLQMLAMILLMLVQAWFCRKLPVERAALVWLGLSVALGAGGFVALQVLPALLGHAAASSQAWSFLLFLLPYIGIALGLTRYRLFDVGQWAFRALFLMFGAALLLVLDLSLAWLLNGSGLATLSLALLLVGFAYLPLRGWLQHKLLRQHELPRSELFARAMGVAFAADAQQRQQRWQDLLVKIFQPLRITPVLDVQVFRPGTAHQLQIVDAGLGLYLPAVADLPALYLTQAHAGRSLFSPQQANLAGRLLDLLEQAHRSRRAYEHGVQTERLRVAQDLHDDIGARLLTAIHRAGEDLRPLLQETLNDVRSIAQGLAETGANLDVLLPELRHETARRCEAAGLVLDWPPEQTAELMAHCPCPEFGAQLDYRARRLILSVVREGVSNSLKHAGASRLAVRYRFLAQQQALQLDIVDDGCGFEPVRLEGHGMGIENLRMRAQRIGAAISWGDAAELGWAQGSLLRLQLPVAAILAGATGAPLPDERGAR